MRACAPASKRSRPPVHPLAARKGPQYLLREDDRGVRARRRSVHAAAWPAETPKPTPGHSMAKTDAIELEGTVAEVLPNATFRVETKSGHQVLATLAGNMRRFRIRVLAGDRVTLEVSPYDLARGRITFRHKN